MASRLAAEVLVGKLRKRRKPLIQGRVIRDRVGPNISPRLHGGIGAHQPTLINHQPSGGSTLPNA